MFLLIHLIFDRWWFRLSAKEVELIWLGSHPSKPQYEKTHWGREGETNLCFRLSEFSTVSRAKFVADVRTYLADKELVLIQENAACSKR
jgi:hypothetical protein